MLRKKKITVEKEQVICENCRFQYSYLFESKGSSENSKTPYSKLAKKDPVKMRKTYVNLKDSYQPCPCCNYVQSWMVKLRKRHLVQEFVITALVSTILIVACIFYSGLREQEIQGVFDYNLLVSKALSHMLVYFILLTVGSLAYFTYLYFAWNPNRKVDQSSYDGAPTQYPDGKEMINSALQYEAASRIVNHNPLPHRKLEFSLTAKLIMGTLATFGILAFLSPSLFPDIIFELNRRGFMMLPFYLGIGFLLMSVVSGTFTSLFFQRRKPHMS